MRNLLMLLAVLAGCERVDHPATKRVEPVSTPVAAIAPAAPAPAPAPAVAPPVLAPAPERVDEIKAPPPRPKRAAIVPKLLEEDQLPKPPEPDDPAAYATWLASLDAQTRANVNLFCKKNGFDYFEVCGGIGPYHIPVPPSLVASVGANGGDPRDDHDTWLANLTLPQRKYYEYWCIKHSNEDIGFSRLCGGTPLVAQFDADAPIAFVAGGVDATKTPWIALDRDGNGTIDRASELFGDGTPLPDGTLAKNGFAALAQYDANGDGVIDRADPIFARLALWDGATLTPLSARIASIELANTRVPRCTRFGCEGERSTMTMADGTRGAVVDVYVRRD